MAAVILIPAVACWAVLAWGSARKALLCVVLPALLLLPQYYVLRLSHLPPLTFAGLNSATCPMRQGLVLATVHRLGHASTQEYEKPVNSTASLAPERCFDKCWRDRGT